MNLHKVLVHIKDLSAKASNTSINIKPLPLTGSIHQLILTNNNRDRLVPAFADMDRRMPAPLNQHTAIPTNVLSETEIDWLGGFPSL